MLCNHIVIYQDGVAGQWEVELIINKLTEADTKGTHSLTIQNEEGQAEYKFELYKGEQPPPGNLIRVINKRWLQR